ncbi:phosphatidylglycerol lysyltransferase domain-containing protein [Jatrophihabitans sp.]|uniref:phosphatidylglycerol lysyltransferase domain-containing protein n=1 Tax=Jatrophihabitans sp. TaxID=1932789 RepID=UPI0030C6941A|nr:Integral rane lysyl-tRNA synthetase [Jatrophihabitans sp.]
MSSASGDPAPRTLRSRYLAGAPKLISTIALLLGVATLVDAFSPDRREFVHRITQVVPVPASAAAAAVTAVSGLLLLRVAAGLRKRKRREWRAAVGIAIVMTAAALLRNERRPIEAAITIVLLVLLVTARSRFTAKADPRNRWFAVRVLVQFFVISVAYGMVLLYSPYGSRHVAHDPSFGARLHEVVTSLLGFGGYLDITGERFSDLFHGTLLAFGLLTILVVALLALRPSEPISVLSADDELRLRGLLRRNGARDSLGYFALRRDKSVVWSATGKAAVTYRVVSGVALASGDPIGDPEAWPGAMAAYRTLVEEFAWTPAVMGCSELGATVFKRECELSALALGDEAILETADFTLDGRAMRGVRQACTKVARAGYAVTVRRMYDVPADELAALRTAADAWRGDDVERGFSMALSRLGDPLDGDCVVATASMDGALRGMLHFVPWGPDGLSLDLMRRDRAAENGLNEFMIAAVMEACGSLGVARVSLNFAVFRDAIERGERIGAGPITRVWRSMLIFASRWWQIESLYRFNAKFRPYWEPRFICFPSARDLPRIAVAALEAEAFIVRPHRLKRLLGRS